VNYMPSSGIGLANGQYFENWVGRGAYDPEVIERDLRRVKAMNLNAVSVFIHHESLGAQHLLDLLRRCEALGLHVNQSLRPGTPMAFQSMAQKPQPPVSPRQSASHLSEPEPLETPPVARQEISGDYEGLSVQAQDLLKF